MELSEEALLALVWANMEEPETKFRSCKLASNWTSDERQRAPIEWAGEAQIRLTIGRR